MSSINHSDWSISEAHLKVLVNNWPTVGVRKPELRKSIPGMSGKRFVMSDMKSGIWMKPMGSRIGRTWSSVRDVGRGTLVLIVDGSTSQQSRQETDYEIIRDRIRELFHDRRSLDLEGELYSRVTVRDYDIDDSISRKFDIDIIEITSWFREDRPYKA